MTGSAGGSVTFAERAERLAGLAGALLGWGPDRFWAATPAELETALRGLGAGAGDTDPPADADLLARMRGMFPDG